MKKFRFLPIFILFLTSFFVSKIIDFYNKNHKLSNLLFIPELVAEDTSSDKKEEPSKEEKKDAKPVAGKYDDRRNWDLFKCDKPFSDIEVGILESLATRREAIEKWAKEVSTKELVLKAAEDKLNAKITDMHSLKSELERLLAEYNQKEDAKINSLVKIYENMKPKDAAKIFEGLEMPILLQVIDRMKEAKTAPILAQMSPEKATELTVQYANQKHLYNIK